MTPLFVSTLVVAITEIGDRTQLLAMLLAVRFKRPWPILAGILVATLANHALAATAGYFVTDLLRGKPVRIAVALSFIAMAAWTLIPDRADDAAVKTSRAGVFLATFVAFFLVEMGDKTQIATVALAARFHNILWVASGTTLGMMIANAPSVFFAEATTKVVPLNVVRWTAAALFLAVGVWALMEALGGS